MKTNLLLIFLGYSLCQGHNALAQKNDDYVITLKQDTLYGDVTKVTHDYINIKLDNGKQRIVSTDIFRAFDAKKNKTYAPSYLINAMEKVRDTDPKMYRINDKKRQKKKPLLTEVITDGPIIVYHFLETKGAGFSYGTTGLIPTVNTSISNHYAFKKATGEIIELKKSGFFILGRMSKKNIGENLSSLFADEPSLLEDFDNEKKLNFDTFLEYIKKYNQLKKQQDEEEKYDMQIF